MKIVQIHNNKNIPKSEEHQIEALTPLPERAPTDGQLSSLTRSGFASDQGGGKSSKSLK